MGSKKGRKLNLTLEDRQKRVKRMLKGKAEAQAMRKRLSLVKPTTRPEVVDYPSVGKDVDKYGPRNLEFEQKVGAPPVEPAAKSKLQPLTEKPIIEDQDTLDRKILADCLKLPFAFWASRAGLPALRLTDQEAKEWAEPTKALMDHYIPKIPGIIYAWVAWSVCTCSIMDKRFVLITAEREKRSAQRSSESQGTVGQQTPQAKPGPIAQGAPRYEPKKV